MGSLDRASLRKVWSLDRRQGCRLVMLRLQRFQRSPDVLNPMLHSDKILRELVLSLRSTIPSDLLPKLAGSSE